MNIAFSIEQNIKQLVRLNETVHDKHHDSHPDVFNKYDRDKFKVWFTDFLSKENTFCIFIKKDEEYIGYALLIHKKIAADNPFNKASLESLHIDQMSIEKEYQNMGIGVKLISHIKTIAKEKGINNIQLDVWSDNVQAKNFYAKNGFATIRENLELNLDS